MAGWLAASYSCSRCRADQPAMFEMSCSRSEWCCLVRCCLPRYTFTKALLALLLLTALALLQAVVSIQSTSVMLSSAFQRSFHSQAHPASSPG